MKIQVTRTTRRSSQVTMEIPDDLYLHLCAAVTGGIDPRVAANVEGCLEAFMDDNEETMSMEWDVQRVGDDIPVDFDSRCLVALLLEDEKTEEPNKTKTINE